MQITTENPPGLFTQTEKYGVPVSCRIPASLKKELGDEAAIRGISLSQQLTNHILTNHNKDSNQSSEITLLLRERERLQQENFKLTQELQALNATISKEEIG